MRECHLVCVCVCTMLCGRIAFSFGFWVLGSYVYMIFFSVCVCWWLVLARRILIFLSSITVRHSTSQATFSMDATEGFHHS
jgi:hypothetical protein